MKGKNSKKDSAKKKWVTITENDVLAELEPDQRKHMRRMLRLLQTRKPKNEEERKFLAQDDARKWNVYYGVSRKVYDEKIFLAAMRTVHQYMEHAEWFANNTPYPFTTNYHSPISNFASVSCRYLCQLATMGNRDAIREIAHIAVAACETLDELICNDSSQAEENAKIMRYTAERLPYWPMLHFKHTTGNNHFPRMATRLRLGSACCINVSESANYSLQTPINAFVWKCLRQFQDFRERIHWAQRQKEDVKDILKRYRCSEEEMTFYQKSYQLPPLTKANAREWADVAVMPYIKLKFSNLKKISAFAGLNTGRSGKRYAPVRKAIIQALRSMAPSR